MAEKKIPLDQKRTGKVKPQSSREQKRTRIKRITKIVLLSLAAVFLLCFITGVAFVVSFIKDAPPFDPEALLTVETSYVYDRDGNEITQLHDEQNRIALPLDEIPPHVQQAFLAIEDERFYQHKGFDTIGFTRALFVNIRTRSFSQGASTISQQLVQNAYLGTEKLIKRKVQEIWLALQLEREYSKPEILEMYLNRIYFGEGAYGVEAAALTLFKKSIADVNIAEAAMMAGLVRAPEYYNPIHFEERAVERMKLVLDNMLRLGFIDESEHTAAFATEFEYGDPLSHEYPSPYFVDHVLHHEVPEILISLPEIETRSDAYKAIYTEGLKIYTTMDAHMQQHVEATLNRNEFYPETVYIDIPKLKQAISANNGKLPADYPAAYIDEENGIPQPQSAMVLSDPQTGEIFALVGGRDYSKKRNEVLRFRSRRQPGSAIKPLLAYAPALEQGILGAGSVLDDSPLYFPGPPEPWAPENYDGTFRGLVTVRDALAYSFNVPAVRAYQLVGPVKGAEYAHNMGISTFNPPEATLSWTLGAREVTALDMAEAFGVFANNGIRMELYTVQRIEDRNGRVIYENKANPRQVLSEQATFIMNSILQDVVRTTTARELYATRPMAAKTGTTDDYRDVYLVAYTPNVVASFWMGYDEKIMGQIRNGWSFTTRFVREVFNEMFKTLPVAQFKSQPHGVSRIEVCGKSGMLPTELCHEAETVRSDFFLSSHVPRLECDMHVMVEICTESELLACEFCPEHLTEARLFLDRPEYLTTDSRWRRAPGRKPADADLAPPTEKCDIHTETAGKISKFKAKSERHNLVELTWDFEGGETKEFQIFRRTGDNEDQLLAAVDGEARAYKDYTVTAFTGYRYTIYAVSQQGVISEPESVAIEKTKDPKDPRKPALNPLAVEGASVTLTWSQDEPEHIDEFVIFRKMEPGEFAVIASGLGRETATYTDTVEESGNYTYYVEARNPAGEEKSNEESVEIELNNDQGNEGNNGNGEDNSRNQEPFWLWALLSRLMTGLAL